MSLYRQLWIAVVIVMLVVFGATFAINGVSSSRYLSEQLTIKNRDDVNALALSLSQQTLDEVSLEIQLATLLDHGSYEFVEFRQADGRISFSQTQATKTAWAPAWIRTLFDIESVAASAEVSSGWAQLGTLSLRSDAAFAYDELWAGAQRAMVALVIATVVAGVLGSALLRFILAPLQQVVLQAEALGERRFIKVEEPKTLEFKQLARVMNALSDRIRDILERESGRLSEQRASNDLDALSGAYTRSAFLSRLEALIESDSASAQGTIALVRISQLPAVNAQFGRDVTDQLISAIGTELQSLAEQSPSTISGRLAGSDFALLVPEDHDPQKVAAELCESLVRVTQRFDLRSEVSVVAACTHYEAIDNADTVLVDAEIALNHSANNPDMRVVMADKGDLKNTPRRDDSAFWMALLREALDKHRYQLNQFPVRDAQNALLQQTGMLYLKTGDQRLPAGMIMPWINRLRLNSELDRAVVELALSLLKDLDTQLCINISVSGLTDPGFAIWLNGVLGADQANAEKLCIDFTESATYAHPEAFRKILTTVRAYGGEVGIKHVGHQLDKMGTLADLGADYLKVDQLFIRGIDANEGSKTLLRAYAAIAQSLGAGCIAEGVSTEAEKATAFACGASAVTGPGV